MRLLVSLFLYLLSTTLLAYAVCPPSREEFKPITKFLEEKFKGIIDQDIEFNNTDDLKWLRDNFISQVLKTGLPVDISDNYLRDAEKTLNKCYKLGDLSSPTVQNSFKKCASSEVPKLLLKYASSGLKACSAFQNDIIPQWDTKYKLHASVYFSGFCKTKGKKC
ncbi:hypothetical protein BDZ94DRAFT_1248554 [Collybia nuda]|uniref:Secreted protein n=1 Tax=Collybia nuda TaxID=64659 RepID=A0A9P6CIH0_9AGAR|nr:hypothetical protein BDZ94DRAFT_1248554 [Collybia nuda]